MKHYGDITKLKGYDLPIVDVITGGSPCQDLSVAGKREGLSGERSGLFMDQIRIIKEMRQHDREVNGHEGSEIRPRYMVWENVPGAFSSNKGEDFRVVLEETSRVIDQGTVIPEPPKGKWQPSGCILGDGWSLAYRVHDAQFWGVPQRRKRIALVADFGGLTAPEILFERQSVSGDPEPSGTEGEGTSGAVEDRLGETGEPIPIKTMVATRDTPETRTTFGVGEPGDPQYTISSAHEHAVVYGISSYASSAMKSPNPHSGVYEAETSRTLDNNGGNPSCNQGGMAVVCATTEMTPKVYEDGISFFLRSRDYKDPQIVCLEGNGSRPSHQGNGYSESEIMYTLNSTEHHSVAYALDQQGGKGSASFAEEVSPSLLSDSHGTSHAVMLENHPQDSRVKISEDGICQTLDARMGMGGGNVPMVMEPVCIGNGQVDQTHIQEKVGALNCMHDQQAVLTYGLDRAAFNQGRNAKYDIAIDEDMSAPMVARGPNAVCQSVVRRLTPLECERLQGFPDGWTEIGDWIDSKGKKRKCSDSARYKALGNSIALPFWIWMAGRMCCYYDKSVELGSLFDGIGGFPLAFSQYGAIPVWASEIEDFPIAVTKKRFPEV